MTLGVNILGTLLCRRDIRSKLLTARVGVDGPVVLKWTARCENANNARNKCSNNENKADKDANLKGTSQPKHETRQKG
ncbi:hypothetical protein IF1G_07657 [Cordyceps javanica]|uniref:Uncharacterized protein n=1 Tax=Cordyceps javanica TaxID=43265 RepID=A0A545UWS4_9HYPO|nr:hypothetical protein IF1G_07657 [Cordyceps javanica]TQW04704.1 hypothetical protein IF2G_07933 [Cordyceps javanica]